MEFIDNIDTRYYTLIKYRISIFLILNSGGEAMKLNNNTFVRLILFKEHECKAVEQYLEEMALKGWILEDISLKFFIFKKSKPKKLKFTVDIFTDLKAGEYIEYCEASGWNYICETNNYLIFCTENDDITPIQTDEDILLNKLSSSMLKNISAQIILTTYMMYTIYKAFFIDFISDAIYDVSLLFPIMISLIFVICPLVDCIYDISWYIKYKKSLKFEEVIVYPTLKRLNIKTTYTNLYIITFIITILTLIGSVSEISIYISSILFFIIAIVSIGKIVKIAIS